MASTSTTSCASEYTIYDNDCLKELFDEMQSSYERVCTITSFGFNRRWRRQLAERLGIGQGMRAGDLMAGSGEAWMYVLPRLGADGALVAVDFSTEMVKQARRRKDALQARNVFVLHEDALCSSIAPESLDVVLCAYGVKTLSPRHQRQFVAEARRILKPGGRVGLVEISVPEAPWLRVPYMLYIGRIIPFLGRLLLGNPDNYRMLGVYTTRFGDCRDLLRLLADGGFDVRYERFFWGCASGVVGVKT